jgi:hypothetical protein
VKLGVSMRCDAKGRLGQVNTVPSYLETGKMNARSKLGRFFKYLAQSRFIADIHFVADQSRPAVLLRQVANLGDPIQRHFGRVDEIIHHNDIVLVLQQNGDGVGSNVSVATSDKNAGRFSAHPGW